MAQIQVEQAVFASQDHSRIRGYQLVARSPGIDEAVAGQLVRWSPSHDALPVTAGPATGLSYFHVDSQRIALARTTEGGPEYSGRGGKQAFTSVLVTSRQHLAGFDNNAWAFLLLAQSQGWLSYRDQLSYVLPTLSVNARWPFGQAAPTNTDDETDQQKLVDEAIEYLKDDKRIAVLEAIEPEPILRQILNHVEPDQRADISFSISLQPSSQRPFQLQFPGDNDIGARSDLSRDGVKLLRLRTAVNSPLSWDRYE